MLALGIGSAENEIGAGVEKGFVRTSLPPSSPPPYIVDPAPIWWLLLSIAECPRLPNFIM
jgi:hypothetical protein